MRMSASSLLGWKVALMGCDPTARVVVEKVATPLAETTPLPMTLAPSRKFTLPVGVPLPVTWAVNVIALLTVAGFGVVESVVVVETVCTVCRSTAVTLGWLRLSPE